MRVRGRQVRACARSDVRCHHSRADARFNLASRSANSAAWTGPCTTAGPPDARGGARPRPVASRRLPSRRSLHARSGQKGRAPP
eukprot:2552141-Prymnesium_polylepis.1